MIWFMLVFMVVVAVLSYVIGEGKGFKVGFKDGKEVGWDDGFRAGWNETTKTVLQLTIRDKEYWKQSGYKAGFEAGRIQGREDNSKCTGYHRGFRSGYAAAVDREVELDKVRIQRMSR